MTQRVGKEREREETVLIVDYKSTLSITVYYFSTCESIHRKKDILYNRTYYGKKTKKNF